MYLWTIKYTIVFRNGWTWERKRTTRADDIMQAMTRANRILRKARELPLAAGADLLYIIREQKGADNGNS